MDQEEATEVEVTKLETSFISQNRQLIDDLWLSKGYNNNIYIQASNNAKTINLLSYNITLIKSVSNSYV